VNRPEDSTVEESGLQSGRLDWRRALRESFGLSFWTYVFLAVALGAACYLRLGEDVFLETFREDIDLVLDLVPRVLAAQLVAGLIWVMVPRERLSALLKRYRGTRGLVFATLAGMLTPGGPATAFPLLALLAMANAEAGVLVAYITSWALLGIQRIIVWDTPFMGIEFTAVRMLISLPLPIFAGMIAQHLRIGRSIADAPGSHRMRK
jgi:hypothetical protein